MHYDTESFTPVKSTGHSNPLSVYTPLHLANTGTFTRDWSGVSGLRLCIGRPPGRPLAKMWSAERRGARSSAFMKTKDIWTNVYV